VSFWGRLSRNSAVLAKHREISLTGAGAALVVVIGGGFAVTSHGAASPTASSLAGNSTSTSSGRTTAHTQVHKPTAPPVLPLKVVSVTPNSGSGGANGTDDIKVTFASDLSPSTSLPKLSPAVSGSWSVSGKTATFTPKIGYAPGTTVTVTVPAGMRAGDALHPLAVKDTSSHHFTTGSYSELRLQELLAQLGYLPITFHPSESSGDISSSDAKAQLSAAYEAPSGSFSWNGSYPSQLTGQWQTGGNNMLMDGAVRAFEYNQGLTMDGQAGPEVWSALLTAVAKHQANPSGYTYALATQGGSNENLQVWHDGKHILFTAANTGVAGAPTKDGTYPVFDRLTYQVMKGTNPNGSKYADPVHWIAYFDGGDAVHGFPRASYGYYQSVGCVEIPISTAQWLYPYLTYGTLVTVQGQPA
jgi:peptidoglycan hydrolase-like protein with peptidoglycan-binding domain